MGQYVHVDKKTVGSSRFMLTEMWYAITLEGLEAEYAKQLAKYPIRPYNTIMWGRLFDEKTAKWSAMFSRAVKIY